LTGTIATGATDPDDFRSSLPRFTQAAIDANQAIVDRVREVAERHHCTPAQVALAWILAQGDHVIPIPGTRRLRHLEDNAGASTIALTTGDLSDLDDLPAVTGTRY
jgi:aryl-alcohol dehydrogenase-like predicted oxidoreductase